jgi:EAL domain-containing protein (putative c-di-GMP-specific phosphodiesterase class I)
MARRLKLRVIAEGVETKEQLAPRTELPCDEYQVLYFSRPLSAEKLTAMFFSASLRR